ncbi:MAG: hypothetical protein Greene041619_1120 [Candidatus Peregrinibacteria bacterium Greene0416_19]|nr:MAG: hypothetical protein Greene041619_1120 [Candidatus Peregrinibacteria bacterium Greene0416_19]
MGTDTIHDGGQGETLSEIDIIPYLDGMPPAVRTLIAEGKAQVRKLTMSPGNKTLVEQSLEVWDQQGYPYFTIFRTQYGYDAVIVVPKAEPAETKQSVWLSLARLVSTR